MAAHYSLTLFFTDEPELLRKLLRGDWNRGRDGELPGYERQMVKFTMPAGQEGKIMAAQRARRLVRENQANFGSLFGPRNHRIDFGEGSL